MNEKKVLEIKNLVKNYGTKGFHTTVLRGIDLEIRKNDFIAVMGPSGSGKTTLLNLLSTIDKPTQGMILLDGQDITRISNKELSKLRRDKIGFIFQDYNLIPSLNVWENIVLPIGLDNRKVNKQEVEQVLEKIGLQDKRAAMPAALSGGQKQRVAIARALATRPAIILADEPTGNLDSHTELEVMGLLKSCVADFGQTLIMITHNETIAQMAEHLVEIADGKVVRAE